MRVLLEVTVKIILQNTSNLPNHSPISYTVKIVGQEVDKNKRTETRGIMDTPNKHFPT